MLTALAWLQEPGTLDAADAVSVAEGAFAAAGVDALIDPAPQPGSYTSASGGGPVPVWQVQVQVDGMPVALWVAEEDGQPVFLDDRAPTGDRQVLSDSAATAIADHRDNPVLARQVLRNVVATAAAVLIALVAVRAAATPTRVERSLR